VSTGAGTRHRKLSPAEDALPGEARIIEAAEGALRGERRGLRRYLPFLGPAFIAAVAYIDPGNFAVNMAAGSQFGDQLLWAIAVANFMAMLVQALSAKLGVATGRNLAELCREHFPRPVVIGLWVQAEFVAMATDLAEFVGAALGINIVFGLPLFVSGLITAASAFGILALQAAGFRRLEAVIAALVAVIVASFAIEVVLARPGVQQVAHGTFVPGISGTSALLLAVGIVGATVMPHVIYLHSALTQGRLVGRTPEIRRRIFRFTLIDVVIALGIAGIVNMAMLAIAAAVFHDHGITNAGENLKTVSTGLGDTLHYHSGMIFGIALLASGISSSSVGTMAGQVVMQGFLRRRIPVFLRRAITMIPALIVLAFAINPARVLVLSQVVLSFGIPFALIPLVMFSRRRALMGTLTNSRITTAAAVLVTVVIVGLNVVLIALAVAG
jgi:manganese transport protein